LKDSPFFMGLFKKNKENLLELIPVRQVEWERNTDTNKINLIVPKFSNVLLRKHLLPRLNKPHFIIKLDELGSFVREQCDGRRNAKQTAEAFGNHFGEKAQGPYVRTAKFLQMMHRERYIVLQRPDGTRL